MEFILDIIGFLLTAGAIAVIIRTLLVWQGILRGGLMLFLAGFLFLGAAFIINFLSLAGYFYLSPQPIFVAGIALLFWGSFKIFTFVYP